MLKNEFSFFLRDLIHNLPEEQFSSGDTSLATLKFLSYIILYSYIESGPV